MKPGGIAGGLDSDGSEHHPHAHHEHHHHAGGSEPHRHYDPETGGWIVHTHGEGGYHRTISIEAPILEKNERLAERNRGFFLAHQTVAINLMSSPGSGKTALLEKTLEMLAPKMRSAVLVGDIATDLDGRRLDGRGAQVLQITTGSTCHLDAQMVASASGKLDWGGLDVLFIENVGNLVCPSSFDLGENYRVVLFSVTEGEDKPLKYPAIFHKADLVLITKIDLAEAVGFDKERAYNSVYTTAPQAKVLEVSTKSGVGLQNWIEWITAASSIYH